MIQMTETRHDSCFIHPKGGRAEDELELFCIVPGGIISSAGWNLPGRNTGFNIWNSAVGE